MAEQAKRPVNPLFRDTAKPEPEQTTKISKEIVSRPAVEPEDEPIMPRTRRRRSVKFDELYDPISSYIDKEYARAFSILIDQVGPNKTTILNEAIYDVILKYRDILEEYNIYVDKLPKPRR